MLPGLSRFRHIVVADFEFEFGGHDTFKAAKRSGERPRPICMVAKDLCSGRLWRLWRGEFGTFPPFPIGPDALFVAFYASAELGCFRALGWPKPAHILDLFTEFRCRTNGPHVEGNSLLHALAYYDQDTIGAIDKDGMRLLALRGGPWNERERADLIQYCETDVEALERLLPVMAPNLDLPYALLRGKYMAAAAAMEYAGTPIDVRTLEVLREHWDGIKADLIAQIDTRYGVYEDGSFRAERWAAWLARNHIPWPVLESGSIDLCDQTFRQMAKAHPQVSPMRELRSALSDLRLNDLAVGHDGRNRTTLSAFRSRTGRNQPSNTHFIFGPSVWIRSIIQPPPDHGVAYIDWSQQEFGIAAALSEDPAMMAAYLSRDPYLEFAKQAGAVPADATKYTHAAQREQFKQCVLAVQYGMESESLALRIGQAAVVARGLLQLHHETFRRFWRWSDAVVDHAMLYGHLHTTFDWRIHVGETANPRSLRNFPMQANGAEMLRLACCLGTERGVEICAPVHDAVMICAPLDVLDQKIETMRAAMAKASQVVLDGFELSTDAKVVKYPDRYEDPRGTVMWKTVMDLIHMRKTRKSHPTENLPINRPAIRENLSGGEPRHAPRRKQG